jgi:hypothetical protein
VRDDGTVISIGRIGARGYVVKDRKLTPHENSNGYLRVSMNLTGKQKEYFVHRLVATHFVENPNKLLVVNHKDGNKRNNHFSNLEWVTSSENNKHAFATGLKTPKPHYGENHAMHKLTQLDVDYIKTVHCPWDSICGSKALAKKFGVRPQTITEIVHGRSWKHGSSEKEVLE